MAKVQGAASILQAATQVEARPKADKKVAAHDPRPELDHVALTGVATHDGQAIQTATRASGVSDAEVKYRLALRDHLRNGTDYKHAEKVLTDSGVAAKEIAKFQAEEASTHFRMARDEFVRSADEHLTLSARFGARPGRQATIRLESLKRQAHASFQGAIRSDALLGGLDPARGRDLEAMEAVLLRMGFPKDQVAISSRPQAAAEPPK